MLVLGVIGLVAIIVLGLGLTARSTSGGVSAIRAVDPESGPAVVGVFADGGLRVLGIQLESNTYRVRVQFAAAGDCLPHLVSGAEWPLAAEACRSDVAIEGTVAGKGRTAFGATTVVVEREVSRQCYEALQPVDASSWPLPEEACDLSP
jgi:hypothetical protein